MAVQLNAAVSLGHLAAIQLLAAVLQLGLLV
jgi:hypothetical protein